MHEYTGTCRCGATTMTLASNLAPEKFQPRSDAQTCHFCREHDGVWISDPRGLLQLGKNNTTAIRKFASQQIQFHFCLRCGELAYATYYDGEKDKEVAVVRVRLFDTIDAIALPVKATNFDQETLAAGRARKLAHWTPVMRQG